MYMMMVQELLPIYSSEHSPAAVFVSSNEAHFHILGTVNKQIFGQKLVIKLVDRHNVVSGMAYVFD